ncbi:MAG: 30S ribosome-binding factor RbfA [Egibacteraceae bacterium]
MSQRVRRVNEAVKEVLASQLVDLKDPRLGFVTVTEVRTSPDLRHAEVFYTVLPDDPESRAETEAGLDSAAGLLRRELGSQLRLKYVPDLHFSHDPLPARGRRIETLLRDDAAAGDRDSQEGEADDAGR